MEDLYAATDARLQAHIGEKLKKLRLECDKTQIALSQGAGVSLYALQSLEKGNGGPLINVIKILRALNALDMLESFFREEPISPVLLAKLTKKTAPKQRASRTTNNQGEQASW